MKPHWDPRRGVVENARATLPPLARKLFAAGRRLDPKGGPSAELHRFRLEVKRFRYTLELFRPLYGPAFDELLLRLRRLQGHLGSINDCVVARSLLTSIRPKRRMSDPQRKVLRLLRKRERSRVKKFFAYWGKRFDAPGEEERWTRYLRSYAGRGRRTPAAS